MDHLGINHLYLIAAQNISEDIKFLQPFFVTNSLSKLEGIFKGIFPRKNPFCLIAIENKRLIGYIITQPNNNRGSCWSISLPKIIEKKVSNSVREIKMNLLRASLKSHSADNWILKYPIDSTDDISIARELGFQPQKLIRAWSINSSNKRSILSNVKNSSNKFCWEKVSKENANLLWKLEKSSESVHFRETIDRQSYDLYNKKNYSNRVLICKEGKLPFAIAGLIVQLFPKQQSSYQIIRDLIWDSRLNDEIPELIKVLASKENEILIESNEKDRQINSLLEAIGLEERSQKIILSKSHLKKSNNKYSSSSKINFESVFRNLEVGNKPIPSPCSNYY